MITHGLNIATTIRATRNIRIAAIVTRLNASGSKEKEKLVGVMMITSQIVKECRATYEPLSDKTEKEGNIVYYYETYEELVCE